MTLSDDVQFLRKIPMFANLGTPKLKLLAFTAERRRFRPGDYLVREGEPGACAFIVIEGDAEILIDTPRGPMAVSKAGQHDMVGEIAVLCGGPRTASVRALTPVVALSLSKDLLFCLMREFPEMAIEMMRVLAQRLERMTVLLRETVGRSTGEIQPGEGV